MTMELEASASRERVSEESRGGFEWIVGVSAGAVVLHAVDAWVLQPEGGPTWTVRMLRLSLLVLAAVAMLLAWRVSGTGGRGTLALILGSGALVAGTAITFFHIRKFGLDRSHYSGLSSLIGGFVLFATGTVTLIQRVRSWWGRLLAIPAFVALLSYVLFPVAVAVYATNAPRVAVGSRTPADVGLRYEDVWMTTESGLRISGWYVPSRNGAAVILRHGSSSTRAATLDHGALLARHGYGVLMVDAQGHGASEGTGMEWGWHGVEDVDAAVDHLLSRQGLTPGRIGVLGLSMGAQEAITAAAVDPRIGAVVSEGAMGQTYEDSPSMGTWVTYPFYRVMFAVGDLLSGATPPPGLGSSVVALGDRPLLLISGNGRTEARANMMFASMGGAGTSWWALPDVSHTHALRTHPDEYERRVIGFLDTALSVE
jgi:uncharacterized protein